MSPNGRVQVSLAKFLMDQSKLSGIGNYLLSETLHLAAVHPFARCATRDLPQPPTISRDLTRSPITSHGRPVRFARCADLSAADWAAVHAAASNVTAASYAAQTALAAARASGSLSLTHGTLDAMAASGDFRLRVYRRTADATRGLPVLKQTGPHGRSIFWVPQMQTRAAPPPDGR